jgi:dTDP-4-amino-4,6-dideoxygalactose transaminase
MWHLYPLKVDPEKRTRIFEKLRSSGIGVQVNYIPAYWHPVFTKLGFEKGMFPASDRFYASEISLPMWVSDKLLQEDYLEKLSKLVGGN